MNATEETLALWNHVTASAGVNVPPYLSLDILPSIEDETAAEARRFLQPWLTYFDLGCVWLTTFHIGANLAIRDLQTPNAEVPRVYLLGAACTYAIGVRRLVLSGLDSPARVVLRSLAEILFTNMSLLTSEDLAMAFLVDREPDEELKFWRKEFSSRRISERLGELEAAGGVPEEARAQLADFRKQVVQWLSRAVHPSFTAAVLTTLPRSVAEPTQHELGTFGRCGVSLFGTLEKACKLIWYFAALGLHDPQQQGRLYYTVDRQMSEIQLALVARDVFSQLVQSHWFDPSPYHSSEAG